MPYRGCCSHLLCRVLQQCRREVRSWIGYHAAHSARPNADRAAISLGEDGIARLQMARPDPTGSRGGKDPCLPLSLQRPVRMRRQVDPLDDEIGTCNKDFANLIEAPPAGAGVERTGGRSGNGTVLMQFARAAIVEQPECRVA